MAKICVIGNGPAGYLSSWLFLKYGHEVTHIVNSPFADAPQGAHIHILGPEIFELAGRLCPALAHNLKMAAQPGWIWARPGNDKFDVTAPFLSRDAMMKILRRLSPNIIATNFDFKNTSYDLYVDATGANRAVIRRAESEFGIAFEIEDCGDVEYYNSWKGHSPNARTYFFRGQEPFRYYFEHDQNKWRLTVITDEFQPKPSPADIVKILSDLEIDAIASSFDRPKTMLGVPARRLCENPIFENKAAKLPLILPIGDALIQTSPSLGFGVASAFQQAVILNENLRNRSELPSLIHPLNIYVDAIWTEAALHQAMKSLG